MGFKIEIDTLDNDAFVGNPHAELRRMLHDDVIRNLEPGNNCGNLKDINGNIVGHWEFKEPTLYLEQEVTLKIRWRRSDIMDVDEDRADEWDWEDLLSIKDEVDEVKVLRCNEVFREYEED